MFHGTSIDKSTSHCGWRNWREEMRSQTYLAMSSVTFMRLWRIKWAPWGCIIVTLNPVCPLVKVFDDFAGVLPVQHERVAIKLRKRGFPLYTLNRDRKRGSAFIYLLVNNPKSLSLIFAIRIIIHLYIVIYRTHFCSSHWKFLLQLISI